LKIDGFSIIVVTVSISASVELKKKKKKLLSHKINGIKNQYYQLEQKLNS
jgi:hypothetical protein